MAEASDVVAAGAVVVRKGPEVLLVHRPKYDDWSFPKGKQDLGEHVTTTAVREVAEETGLDVRLGPPLSVQRYPVVAGHKVVHWWVGRAVGGEDVSSYQANDEVDEVTWVPLSHAAEHLTYDRDRALLDELEHLRRRSSPLVVLRHAKSRSRKAWRGDDRERPLNDAGRLQAEQVVAILSAYGVRRVLSSSSRRCWSTLSPYADLADVDLQVTRDLSEEDSAPRAVARHVHRLLERAEPSVLCTHRPVLPSVYDALGVGDPELEAGAMLVVHHRNGQILALEKHLT